MSTSALVYHEPPIATILILSSFLLLLNTVGAILDNLIYCGLVGQILVGIGWGGPGTSWLSTPTQEVFVQLGYLGLILLVFEGGLSTSFQALKSNLSLSVCVACTGIVAPIGMSFVLMPLVGATPIQAFAAGAALCSTSLGTTFTLLKTNGLATSRLGVVLTSAAMLDDVVGLVMVQIISNLGGSSPNVSAATVLRPIGVSVAFAVVVLLVCVCLKKSLAWKSPLSGRGSSMLGNLSKGGKGKAMFLIHTAVLIAFVAASSYAGTSNLFASYLAGASISWYDSEVAASMVGRGITPRILLREFSPGQGDNGIEMERSATPRTNPQEQQSRQDFANPKGTIPSGRTGLQSPTTSEFSPLSSAAKASKKEPDGGIAPPDELIRSEDDEIITGMLIYEHHYESPVSKILKPLFFASIGFSIPISQMFTGPVFWRGLIYAILMGIGKLFCGVWLVKLSSNLYPGSIRKDQVAGRSLPRPKSLYPAAILGCAMVARGEIGFLISAVAESRGIFASGTSPADQGSSEIFLIVTWAIMLCTIVGPVAVGLLTRRVQKLRKQKTGSGAGKDPLEMWGVR